jgi:hypothetical protein
MKRIRLLVLAGAIAVALPFGITAAGATGGSQPPNSVTINEKAQYHLVGAAIFVGLKVRCQPAGAVESGVVDVIVHQDYPETPNPGGANGVGFNAVVCDGVTRNVAVSVPPGFFDAGRAFATAIVTAPTGDEATASKWITIVHV